MINLSWPNPPMYRNFDTQGTEDVVFDLDEEKATISTTAPDITVAASQSIDEQDGGIRVADIDQQMFTDFLD